MAVYNTDLMEKGTILRQSHQEEGNSTVVTELVVPVGTEFEATDTIHIARLAPYTALAYIKAVFPGMNAGADSGVDGIIGYTTAWSGLADDPDGYAAAADDDGIVEASDTGTRGTVFPGTGPTGLKIIYSEDYLDVVWTCDAASSDAVTAGYNTIRFFLEYQRVDLSGGQYDKNLGPTPINFQPDPPIVSYDPGKVYPV